MLSSTHLFFIYSIIVLPLLLNKCHGFVFQCVTWDGNDGLCIDRFSCPGYKQTLSKYEKFANEIWMNSPCRTYQDNFICCGHAEGKLFLTFDVNKIPPNVYKSDTTTTTTTTTTTNTISPRIEATSYEEVMEQYRNKLTYNLLPGSNRCGRQQADNRLTYGNGTYETGLQPDEFPWLVHIIPNENAELLCTGVLINANTVLTSYNCGSIAIKARLGVFRLNETETCVRTSAIDTDEDCKSVVERDVEFVPNSAIPELGILKLESTIFYDEYIRTICLPFKKEVRPVVDQNMFLSGWHLVEDKDSGVSKHKIIYRVVENEECAEAAIKFYPKKRVTFCIEQLHNYQVSSNFDVAEGPIMYKHQNNWYLAGFRCQTIQSISEDANSTRISGTLIISTETLKWILDNVEKVK